MAARLRSHTTMVSVSMQIDERNRRRGRSRASCFEYGRTCRFLLIILFLFNFQYACGEEPNDAYIKEPDLWYQRPRTIANGRHHSCAILDNGVKCFGAGHWGQLGYGQLHDVHRPDNMPYVQIGDEAVRIAAGDRHTCVVTRRGDVYCWGDGSGGRLGYGNADVIGDTQEATPAMAGAVNVGTKAIDVCCGASHTCVLTAEHTVRCWGRNVYGQLGYGHSRDVGHTAETVPAALGDVPIGASVRRVACGAHLTCVVTMAGRVKCWGSGVGGALGLGDTLARGNRTDTIPSALPAIDVLGDNDQSTEEVVEVAAGVAFVCALTRGGRVKCWGEGVYGKTGHGVKKDTGVSPGTVPSQLAWTDTGVLCGQLYAGLGEHVCCVAGLVPGALTDGAGEMRCWGANAHGQLGYGHSHSLGGSADTVPRLNGHVPVRHNVLEAAIGVEHTCLVLLSGEMRCYGWNRKGKLGNGNCTHFGQLDHVRRARDAPNALLGDTVRHPHVIHGGVVNVGRYTQSGPSSRVLSTFAALRYGMVVVEIDDEQQCAPAVFIRAQRAFVAGKLRVAMSKYAPRVGSVRFVVVHADELGGDFDEVHLVLNEFSERCFEHEATVQRNETTLSIVFDFALSGKCTRDEVREQGGGADSADGAFAANQRDGGAGGSQTRDGGESGRRSTLRLFVYSMMAAALSMATSRAVAVVRRRMGQRRRRRKSKNR